jgi:hypothetical protein
MSLEIELNDSRSSFDIASFQHPRATKLRGLLMRLYGCVERDEELSHDIWWELIDIPSGAARVINGRRETDYYARDATRKPFWRPLPDDHFGDGVDRPLLIESIDRVADFIERVLPGWRWQLQSGGGPDNEKCFACVYDRFGAFSAVSGSRPLSLLAAAVEAKIAVSAYGFQISRADTADGNERGLLRNSRLPESSLNEIP